MMEFLNIMKNTTIILPAWEITVLVGALSFFLVTKRTNIGLIAAYVFSYHWGFRFFAEQSQNFFVAYCVLGGVVGLLTVISMMSSNDH